MEESVLTRLSEKSGLNKAQLTNMLEDYMHDNGMVIANKDNWTAKQIGGILKMLDLKNTFNNLNLISKL